MQRRTFLSGSAAVAVPLVAGCSGGSGNGGGGGGGATVVQTTSVSMRGSQYHPRNVAVDAGATVTWTNEDSFEHTVTSASDNWSMDASVPAGGQTSHTFEDDGVYDVYCTIHGGADLSGMSMKVGVGDATIQDPLGGSNGGAY